MAEETIQSLIQSAEQIQNEVLAKANTASRVGGLMKRIINYFSQNSGGGTSTSQVQSDWAQSDNTKVDYIKNKPLITNMQTFQIRRGGDIYLANDGRFIALLPSQNSGDLSMLKLRVFRRQKSTITNFFVHGSVYGGAFINPQAAITANFTFNLQDINYNEKKTKGVNFNVILSEFEKIKKDRGNGIYIGGQVNQNRKGIYIGNYLTNIDQKYARYTLFVALVKENIVVSNYIEIRPYFHPQYNKVMIV